VLVRRREYSGEVVGTIGCHVVDREQGHIRGMAVLPSWQGCGVAAQLLQSVESELRGIGGSRMTLDTTEPLLPAMRFYEKNGFRRSGRVTGFFGMPLIEYLATLSE
jgi:GNAT superfamily N-acetyltransferase